MPEFCKYNFESRRDQILVKGDVDLVKERLDGVQIGPVDDIIRRSCGSPVFLVL